MMKNLLEATSIHKGFYTFLVSIINPSKIYKDQSELVLKPIPYALFALALALFLYFSIGNDSRSTWFDAMSQIDFNEMELEQQQRLFGYLNVEIADWNSRVTNTTSYQYFIEGVNKTETDLDTAVRARHDTIYADEIANKMIADGYQDIASYFFAGKEASDEQNAYIQGIYYVVFVLGIISLVIGFMPLFGVKIATTDVFHKALYVNSSISLLYGAVSIMEFLAVPLKILLLSHQIIQFITIPITFIHFRYIEGAKIWKVILGLILSVLVLLCIIFGLLWSIESLGV